MFVIFSLSSTLRTDKLYLSGHLIWCQLKNCKLKLNQHWYKYAIKYVHVINMHIFNLPCSKTVHHHAFHVFSLICLLLFDFHTWFSSSSGNHRIRLSKRERAIFSSVLLKIVKFCYLPQLLLFCPLNHCPFDQPLR